VLPTVTAGEPIAVGGVGGSGTRLVAQFLLDLGFFLGGDLNASNDTLWFTLLFKRREILGTPDAAFRGLVELFCLAMSGRAPLTAAQRDLAARLAEADRPDHDVRWLRERVLSLEAWTAGTPRPPRPWGWKEPNTHVVLPRLARLLPGLRYVHVVRNGLDMAYSSNQAQVRLWGPPFLGLDRLEPSPRLSLKYWCEVHRRMLEAGKGLGERFLMLNYDRLCREPEQGLDAFLLFLGARPAPPTRDRLLASIRPSESAGRYRRHPPGDFDPGDVAFARALGFDTDY
jgi:hypothetical protein